MPIGMEVGLGPGELQTFITQDLSFPKTKGPYGELSFPGLFVCVLNYLTFG